MFNPPRISTTTVADAVAERLGIIEFPVAAAEPLAELFARSYLDNPPGREEQREADLDRFLPGDQVERSTVLFPLQDLIAGPYLVGEPEIIDDSRAMFTFRAQIARESEKENPTDDLQARWIFLSVPVFADEFGAVRIAGLPAFVPGPQLSSESAQLEYRSATQEDEASILTDLNTFFAAWGAGDTDVLQRYVSPDPDVETSPAVTTGLGSGSGNSFVRFVEIAEIDAEYFTDGTSDPIRVQVKVIWEDGGQEVEQSYLLSLRYNDGLAWYVENIQGGSFF